MFLCQKQVILLQFIKIEVKQEAKGNQEKGAYCWQKSVLFLIGLNLA
jgi:hypothetical protein